MSFEKPSRSFEKPSRSFEKPSRIKRQKQKRHKQEKARWCGAAEGNVFKSFSCADTRRISGKNGRVPGTASVEPLEAPSTPSETPNPEKLLSHVSVPLETMTSEGDERELRLLHARPSKNSFPSSKEDLEETRLLLLNQIDRLQKLELK